MLKNTQNKLESIQSMQLHHSSLVVDDLNNRLLRNNVIFKGIVEQDLETWQQTEELVTEFVSKYLGIAASEIERAHRIGQKRPGHTRSIIVKFLNFKEKTTILKNEFKQKKLESSRVWIEEDFSLRMQFIRKKLRDFTRYKQKPGESFKLLLDKHLLDSRIYVHDHITNEVTALPKRHVPAKT